MQMSKWRSCDISFQAAVASSSEAREKFQLYLASICIIENVQMFRRVFAIATIEMSLELSHYSIFEG